MSHGQHPRILFIPKSRVSPSWPINAESGTVDIDDIVVVVDDDDDDDVVVVTAAAPAAAADCDYESWLNKCVMLLVSHNKYDDTWVFASVLYARSQPVLGDSDGSE